MRLSKGVNKGTSNNTQMNEETLRGIFEKCPDVRFQDISFGESHVLLIHCEGMVDQETINHVIFERLQLFMEKLGYQEVTKSLVLDQLHIPSIAVVKHSQEMILSEIFFGKMLLYFKETKLLFSTDISKRPQRSPEESKMEVTIKGPRDNFIEDIAINTALIRKRLPTNSLCIEKFKIGRRTKTIVSMLYMDDIANPHILEIIQQKLNSIDIEGLYSGHQLMEYIEKERQFFPRHGYTGRPDHVVQSLLSGRVILLIDGISFATITPVNLSFLLKTAEDKEYSVLNSSIERLVRVFGILIAMFLPAFWVALTSFHQNQIPIIFLSTVVEARQGVPLPTPLEALLMLALFELFREAGLRLPMAIGQTLSVVGGLIIGDAAIRASLTSPAMVVVIAASVIATFTLINQSLIGTVSLLRFLAVIATSFFGLFGFFLSIFFVLVYLANIRTYGIPYLAMATRISFGNILKTLFRLPEKKYISRPGMFDPKDPTRKKRN